jgi:endonuclease YncB( thermonuclease family)
LYDLSLYLCIMSNSSQTSHDKKRGQLQLVPVLVALIVALSTRSTAANEPCGLGPVASVRVAAIRDGRTLVLDDGRELRLAGIEVSEESKTTLQALAEGRTLQIKSIGADHDRYGRLVGFAFLEADAPSLQASLLAQGAARVSARVGDAACAQALLAIERDARQSRHGLWADARFAPLPASDLTKVQGQRGHFSLIEGKVLSVRQSGATIYLNFGRHWTHDFSVSIPRRLLTNFTRNGIDLMGLENRRIRVRGWIEQRRGAIMPVDAPEQVEIVN